MVSGQYLDVRAGTTRPISIDIKQANGTPANLAGLTGTDLKFDLSQGGEVKLSKDLTSGISITDAANGKAMITLAAADTEQLSGRYSWLVCLTTTDDETYDVADGTLVVLGSEPVSLTMAKAFLKVEHDEDDPIIASLITAARQLAESYVGRSLSTETTASYELGYAADDVPGPIKLAILRTVATHFENREDEVVGTVVARLSSDAEALLDAYRVVGL